MAFKPIHGSSEFKHMKFDKEGQTLEGYYLGSGVVEINGDPVTNHKFQSSEGLIDTLSSADLDRKLSQVPPGLLARITYNGKKKLKAGKTLKSFLVEVDEDDSININESIPSSDKALG